MKLKDYFKEQNNYQISTSDKLFLYDKIISKQNKSTKRLSRFINIKHFAYWFISVVLLFWIYWIYFNWNISYEDFIIKNWNTQVNADYIAKVIDFDGDFYVNHDGKLYKTNKISDWDNVILKKWAEIVFDINSWAQAKLVGPARFSLYVEDGRYQLIISEWDYIQMESTTETDSQTDIVLSQDDITISSEKNLNVLITKSDDEYKINNQWWSINVTKNNKTKQVETSQLLAIKENDITLINNVEDFKEAFTKQSVSQTFAVKDNSAKSAEDTASALINEITTNSTNSNKNKDTKTINTWVANELWVLDGKQVPTEDQSKTLNSTLDKESLLWTLESMYKAQLKWNSKEYSYYKNNLNSKIDNIYRQFNIKNEKWDILSNIATLKAKLSEWYYVPSSKLNNLTIVWNRIAYIQNQWLWSITEDDMIDESWNKLMNSLPSNLMFN